MSNNNETNEELISDGEPIQGLPRWIRILVSFSAVVILFLSVFLMWKYIGDPKSFASPKELQLTNLLIFSLTVLILVLVPWEKMGIRIRKIGAVEFDRIVSGQAREHAEELAELRARIEELEGTVGELNEVASITKHFSAQELRPILLKFLSEYQPQAYSPLRIYKWGSRQPGYEGLGKYSQGTIRTVLQGLVSEGRVATRVSRLGNTLYKVVD